MVEAGFNLSKLDFMLGFSDGWEVHSKKNKNLDDYYTVWYSASTKVTEVIRNVRTK